MTRQELIRLAEQKIIRLDGATGTELIKRGLMVYSKSRSDH